jgi:hypothetical protein
MTSKRSIVLFTACSPRVGRSAILRSLIPRLISFDVTWLYTSARDDEYDGAEWIGPWLGGGAPVRELSQRLMLWSGMETDRLIEVTRTLLAHPADAYWIPAHGEGTWVARALLRRGARVHLAVLGDIAQGIGDADVQRLSDGFLRLHN